ncbi:rCG38182 [Rattus norvegicus]|uniref:RCG38182 n=1 Tax=Rattus norvegicus TaxID=10116 RepID=A6IV70_RAT|nr:rCG38182 [Rattus norvegicus]
MCLSVHVHVHAPYVHRNSQTFKKGGRVECPGTRVTDSLRQRKAMGTSKVRLNTLSIMIRL